MSFYKMFVFDSLKRSKYFLKYILWLFRTSFGPCQGPALPGFCDISGMVNIKNCIKQAIAENI